MILFTFFFFLQLESEVLGCLLLVISAVLSRSIDKYVESISRCVYVYLYLDTRRSNVTCIVLDMQSKRRHGRATHYTDWCPWLLHAGLISC